MNFECQISNVEFRMSNVYSYLFCPHVSLFYKHLRYFTFVPLFAKLPQDHHDLIMIWCLHTLHRRESTHVDEPTTDWFHFWVFHSSPRWSFSSRWYEWEWWRFYGGFLCKSIFAKLSHPAQSSLVQLLLFVPLLSNVLDHTNHIFSVGIRSWQHVSVNISSNYDPHIIKWWSS